MEARALQAEVREERGKGPARRLRRQGKVPAVLYGQGLEPTPLTVDPSTVEKLLGEESGRNQLLEIEVEGETHLALVKDMEVHPVSRRILHIDFHKVSRERPVFRKVPFLVEGRAVGVQKGGKLRKLFRVLPVRCLPQDVPPSIVLDVGPLDLGAVVRVSDLSLPEGVTVTYPADRRVLLLEGAKERGGKKKGEEAEEEEAE